MLKLQRYAYRHVSPERLHPDREESRIDERYLRLRAFIPEVPGYLVLSWLRWQSMQAMLERTPRLQPDNRAWARASMRSEGLVFDASRLGVRTRTERRGHMQLYEPANRMAGGNLVHVESFAPTDFNARTVFVMVGNTVNNLVWLERESTVLAREVFSHLPVDACVVYLQDTLDRPLERPSAF